MYCIDGELTVRRIPETLLGEFELFHTNQDGDPWAPERHFKALGSRDYVEGTKQRWIEEAGLDPDARVACIETVEAAEKHTPPQQETVGLETRHEPNIIEVIEAFIPGDREILAGYLALWHETRKPLPRRYSSAAGSLLELIEYETGMGWFDTHQIVEGKRTVKGHVTPRRHDIKVVSHIEGRDYKPGSPLPVMRITDIEANLRKPKEGRYLNISKMVKKIK